MASRQRASSGNSAYAWFPGWYAHLNPMTYEHAVRMEVMLADSLRKRGYVVFGGH